MGVQEVFKDLYNLEINLIESPNMTGRKMDTFSSGMAQIVNKYAEFLSENFFEPTLQSAARADLQPPDGQGERTYCDLVGDLVGSSDATYSKRSFEILAAAAELLVDRHPFDDADERRGVTIRVLGVSQQLRFVADRRWGEARFLATEGDPGGLTDSERLQIRKAWDIGRDVVVIQTVAQLDGDIIMRIAPSRESDAYQPLHRLNQQLVSTSLRHWQVLFETVATMAGSSVSRLLGR